MKQTPITKTRYAIVRQSNQLIQKSRYEMSAIQDKVVRHIISKIKPWDEDFTVYEFDIQEFCKTCGIVNDGGGNYTTLKKAIKEIADKSVWVKLDNGQETLVRWIKRPIISPNSGIIQIELDELMKPFLLQLKENYTEYEFCQIAQFKSKYSIRLYELMQSIHYNELVKYERIYSTAEIMERMGGDTIYKEWRDFRRKALEPAIAEINACSDKRVEYEPITQGRKVIQIKLKVSTKECVEVLMDRRL